jgi:hypothetical protein
VDGLGAARVRLNEGCRSFDPLSPLVPLQEFEPRLPLATAPPSAWRASPRRPHRAAARAARPFQVVRLNHSSLSHSQVILTGMGIAFLIEGLG